MEMTNFDEWIKTFKLPEVTYFAVYDRETGEVTAIYPSHSVGDMTNVIEVDKEVAEAISEGKLRLNTCYVDLTSGKFEIAELKTLQKIDDVLHRVIDSTWSTNDDPDLVITHNLTDRSLKFELSERYNGTKKSNSKITRKIFWNTATEMNFLITEYNDPHVIKEILKFSINDLIGNSKIFEDLDLPKKFSIYTKRLFPSYVMETE